jgi:UDP-2,3-diacylglucosamine pyrophosphatase LpxH
MSNADLPTREEALALLEPYRGQQGRYRDELGNLGKRALWVLADGSPTTGAEFLGYKSYSPISEDFQSVGLTTRKRNHADPTAGWRRFDNEPEIDDIRAAYLNATGGTEHALEYFWTVPAGTEYARLICVSDLHYGEASMDYRRWLDLRDWIGEHPDARWAFHGDLFDLATVNSPGTSMCRQSLNFEQARKLAREDIAPIAEQCICLLTGNHDQRIARGLQIEFDPVRDVAEDLGIPHLGYEGFVRYSVGDGKHTQEYTGYHHHGTGSGQTWGSFFNSLERLAIRNEADFVVMGHRHQRAAVTTTKRQVAVDNHIEVADVPLVGAGSFLKHEHGTYAADKGYSPSVLGSATVHLHVDRHSVHARA